MPTAGQPFGSRAPRGSPPLRGTGRNTGLARVNIAQAARRDVIDAAEQRYKSLCPNAQFTAPQNSKTKIRGQNLLPVNRRFLSTLNPTFDLFHLPGEKNRLQIPRSLLVSGLHHVQWLLEYSMEDVMSPPPLGATFGSDSNPDSALTVKYSDEFECGLADFGCAPGPPSETKLGVGGLAVNVVVALSKTRHGLGPMNLEP
jgi:hypothetical protein